MLPFAYQRAGTLDAALAAAAKGAKPLAGGTTLIDLMRLEVMAPPALVDISGIAELRGIAEDSGGLRFGALARMGEAQEHAAVRRLAPALADSLLLAASQQLRNAASLAGNLMQRTRCTYFRDPAAGACNKRDPGTGCSAIDGSNRGLAVLGWTERCVANFPGDFGAALAAFDATIEVAAPGGTSRVIPYPEFHVGYGDDPARETTLAPGEVITAIRVAAAPTNRASAYVKLRDRESYAYALASAAVALHIKGGRIVAARVALGGLATRPWRAPEAEAALIGHAPDAAAGTRAGDAAMRDARPLSENAFKIELGRRAVAQAVLAAAQRV